jgi:hypothetical protein
MDLKLLINISEVTTVMRFRPRLVPALVSDRESEISVEKVELTLLDAELSLSRLPVLATIRTALEVNAATFA